MNSGINMDCALAHEINTFLLKYIKDTENVRKTILIRNPLLKTMLEKPFKPWYKRDCYVGKNEARRVAGKCISKTKWC